MSFPFPIAAQSGYLITVSLLITFFGIIVVCHLFLCNSSSVGVVVMEICG